MEWTGDKETDVKEEVCQQSDTNVGGEGTDDKSMIAADAQVAEGSDSEYMNPTWNTEKRWKQFLEEEPLVYPRSWVAGHGKKDWRGKSPEYSDPDLPDLENVDLPTHSRDMKMKAIPASWALQILKQPTVDEDVLSILNETEANLKEYNHLKEFQLYHNDSW
eukprot:CAMPEP_0167743416 /NCGR_PEP_ID=MMETSP0110_2-20121227/2006_1 /TAXON_ID=629695 /ORGANISM="Gymnochlora sp., Strain CCMP2014" /LENGTH=161 /DNA_ID=CAMNT_0007627789 /DNA_START=187 /DNA_END=669 /DNA_ORIENTATION=+